MNRRHSPEEFEDAGPLFARVPISPPIVRENRTPAEIAHDRADSGIARASAKAQAIDPAWRETALVQVFRYAELHDTFLAEDIGIEIPAGADPRAAGGVIRRAEALKWIAPAGYAPANSSNRSPKVLWRSRVFAGAVA